MKSYDKVIFVSKGNTFSSPLVEAIYRDKAPNWLPESMSRGTVVLFSEPINPKVNVLLSSHDINISNHENSKQLEMDNIGQDTLILTMTFSDKLKVIEDLGVSNNVYTLGEYIEDDADISDPLDPDETLYDKFFEEVAEKIEKVILHMEAEYHENDDDAKDVNNKEVLLAKSKRKEMNNTFSSDADDLKNDEIEKLQDILNDELFILVNKNNKLAIDYEPNTLVDSDIAFEEYIDCKQLDKRTSNAAKEMFNAALKENINLIAISGYRSYSVQENLYNSRVEVKGIEKTRQYTAEPGASEHQTGLAIDIVCNDYPYLDEEFENTDAFKWLFNNCYKYGFILRYQKGKEDITGYNYEPWHFRYIGDVDIAKDIMERGICFEEFIDEVNSKIEELQGMDN